MALVANVRVTDASGLRSFGSARAAVDHNSQRLIPSVAVLRPHTSFHRPTRVFPACLPTYLPVRLSLPATPLSTLLPSCTHLSLAPPPPLSLCPSIPSFAGAKWKVDKKALDECVLRRMFVVPAFEIHGGVAGLYDYGPPGAALKENLLQVRSIIA